MCSSVRVLICVRSLRSLVLTIELSDSVLDLSRSPLLEHVSLRLGSMQPTVTVIGPGIQRLRIEANCSVVIDSAALEELRFIAAFHPSVCVACVLFLVLIGCG